MGDGQPPPPKSRADLDALAVQLTALPRSTTVSQHTTTVVGNGGKSSHPNIRTHYTTTLNQQLTAVAKSYY